MKIITEIHQAGLLTIKKLSVATGISLALLRIWELRHGYPKPDRMLHNNYRVYHKWMVDELRDFEKAGRPFHQIRAGIWDRPTSVVVKSDPLLGIEVPDDLRNALIDGRIGTITDYIYSLDVFAPYKRTQVINAIRVANDYYGGKYNELLKHANPAYKLHKAS